MGISDVPTGETLRDHATGSLSSANDNVILIFRRDHQTRQQATPSPSAFPPNVVPAAERIAPDPGDEVDPQRHEVLMRVASDQPADAVAEVHRPGYEMGGKVIRTAQVLVSDGSGGE